MLGKLLKYDFKAILKFWWIAAVSSVVLSVAGGFALSLLVYNENLPTAVTVLLGLFLVVVFLGLTAFVVVSTILVFVRFYKNFFTDEGYLTFTLPVKRSSLLNSKLISSICTITASAFLFIIDIIILLAIGIDFSNISAEAMQEFSSALSHLYTSLGGYIFIYIAQGIVAMLISSVFSTLLMFFCITFAAMISKKSKALAAIGIYYASSYIIGIFTQLFAIFGIGAISQHLEGLSFSEILPIIAVIALVVLIFMALACLLLYTLEYWMLDRKLNLN